MKKFPMMAFVPSSRSSREATNQAVGFFSVGSAEYGCFIRLADAERSGELRCDQALCNCLRSQHGVGPSLLPLLKLRLQEASSIEFFLDELVAVVDRCGGGGRESTFSDQAAVRNDEGQALRALLVELESVGWDRVVSVNAGLDEVVLQAKDRDDRRHLVSVGLPAGWHAAVAGGGGGVEPRISIDCPEPLPTIHVRGGGGAGGAGPAGKRRRVSTAATGAAHGPCVLQSVLLAAEGHLNKFCNLWRELDILDRELWVLDPARPTRASTFRRLALGDHRTLHIELDWRAPRDHPPPAYRVFGAEPKVAPLRALLAQSLGSVYAWQRANDQLPVMARLERILGFPLPRRTASAASATSIEFDAGECSICCEYRRQSTATAGPKAQSTTGGDMAAPSAATDGATAGDDDDDIDIPSIACENERCARHFHPLCLYEWLRSIPGAANQGRISFATLFGECPVCSTPISVQIPSKQ